MGHIVGMNDRGLCFKGFLTKRMLQMVLILTLGLLLTSGAVVFVVRAYTRPVAEPTNGKRGNTIVAASVNPVATTVSQDAPKDKLRTEHVTAFRYGFEPEEITRRQGAFMLCVDNRAGAEALSLRLSTSETKSLVHAEPIPKGRSGTHRVLNLAPGVYILTEDSHPGWFCTITITE